MDTGPIMNLADDLNAVIIIIASCTSQGLLLLFYINIETLPRYFSFDLYLMDRTYGNETRWIYGTLGDTLNHLVINTEGTPNGQPGNPFNQTSIVVTTADKGIDQRIRAAAQGSVSKML